MYGAMTTLLEALETDQAADLEVIGWGCPVPFFGHLESARLATVGINPSNREFVGTDGNELAGQHRRLPTLGSLGLPSWSQADFVALRSILFACRDYFERNPYDGWFGSLQRIIEPTGHSYYAPRSDACHLDVVPWATTGKWGGLSSAARRQLTVRAAEALADIIACSPLMMLILNGQEVVRQFEALAGRQLDAHRVPDWDLPRRSGRAVPGLAYCGRISSIARIPLDRELLVVGYNHNLQSSFGVTTAVRDSISKWITDLYRTL
jgi:hypothetical protein